MKINFYLVVSATFSAAGYQKGAAGVRVTKNKPNTGPSEVAVYVTLDLPNALFKKPTLTANLVVPDDLAPVNIAVDVQESIAQAIRDASGLDVRLTVEPPT